MQKEMPRAQRDTLFLVVLVAWLISPQLPFLPLWCSGASLAVLLWRAGLAWGARPVQALVSPVSHTRPFGSPSPGAASYQRCNGSNPSLRHV